MNKWIKIINAKYGLNAFDTETLERIKMFSRVCKKRDFGDWYLVWIVFTDWWGDKVMDVVSFGTAGGSLKKLLEAQDKIESIARKSKCRWLRIGSEMDDRYNKFLERRGYAAFSYKKEVL